MLYSQLFAKTTKNIPSDEVSKNAQLLIRAGFVHKTMAGVYSYLPLGLRVLNKIENIVRQNLNKIGGQEILMNSLHPKNWWETTKRWEGVDILFKLKSQTETEYALACSHEEQVTPIIKNFINSYKDLPEYKIMDLSGKTPTVKGVGGYSQFPLCVYQIQTKFRDELRSKSGLLRGREFRMKDMYDFHTTKESQDNYYELVKQTYLKIYDQMGLFAFAVHASGGIFTENDSHEFQVICGAGEDEILYSKDTNFAVNTEVYDKMVEQKMEIPKNLEKAVSAEVGNIFKLDVKYSEAFGVSVTGSENQKITPLMNCHGIGTSRCMGVIAEIYSDELGLKWPESVAPFKFHIITNLGKNEEKNAKILEIANNLYSGEIKIAHNKENGRIELINSSNLIELSKFVFSDFETTNGEIFWDDRIGISIGQKLADADLMGMPYQLIISEKSLENHEKEGGVEIKKR